MRWIAVVSTAYCLTGTMADGSWTRAGSVANNFLPLGARIEVSPPHRGQRIFVVRDRIGWGTQLDFWEPSCASAIGYGRRVVRIRRYRPLLARRLPRPRSPYGHIDFLRLDGRSDR